MQLKLDSSIWYRKCFSTIYHLLLDEFVILNIKCF